jgi:hypothetical protein
MWSSLSKKQQLLIGLIVLIVAAVVVKVSLFSTPRTPVTWYVRADGGTRHSSLMTSGQCDGQADVAYPGSGVNQHCAFNDFRYLWDDDSGLIGAGSWIITGGDTVIVRGCHALPTQQNPSNPACRLGWDINSGGGASNNWCNSVGSYTCYNPPIPSGTASAHTKIYGGCVGAGTCNSGNVTNRGNLTQLFSGFSLQFALNFASTSYVDFEGFELTTHNGACSHHGAPPYPRGCSTSPPLDDYGDNGILTNNATSNVTFQDVYIDGFESNGLFGPIGGPITMTRVNVSFNMQSGWQFDDGVSTANGAGSSVNASYVTMNGNGCKQQYPIPNPMFPALACWDSNSGGFGDAWSGQNTEIDSFVCDHCVMLYNTKDAFIGPHTQVNLLTITNSYSAGNMGAQMKFGETTSGTIVFQNNILIMNPYRMTEILPGAAQNFNQSTGLGGSYLTNYGRAGGDGMAFLIRAGSINSFYGNTIIAANPTIMDINCGYVDAGGVHEETNCGSAVMDWKNNHFLGYTDPIVGSQPGMWFFDPGAGGSIPLSSSYNNYYGVRNYAPDACGTNHITCNDPQLVSQPVQPWPGTETALDVYNAFATGNSLYPKTTSPLLGAGIAILTRQRSLWNRITGKAATGKAMTDDYYGTARPNPPAMGAVELSGAAPPPTLTSVTVSPNPGSVMVSATLPMTCTAHYSDTSTGTCATPTWTDTHAHSTINSSGVVTGTSAGSDTITATVGTTSGTATVNVTAAPPPTLASMVVTPNPGTVAVTAALPMTCTAHYSDSSSGVCATPTWTDTNVHSTINSSGVVTGTSAGSDTITAMIAAISGTATVTVTGGSSGGGGQPIVVGGVQITPATNVTITDPRVVNGHVSFTLTTTTATTDLATVLFKNAKLKYLSCGVVPNGEATVHSLAWAATATYNALAITSRNALQPGETLNIHVDCWTA